MWTVLCEGLGGDRQRRKKVGYVERNDRKRRHILCNVQRSHLMNSNRVFWFLYTHLFVQHKIMVHPGITGSARGTSRCLPCVNADRTRYLIAHPDGQEYCSRRTLHLAAPLQRITRRLSGSLESLELARGLLRPGKALPSPIYPSREEPPSNRPRSRTSACQPISLRGLSES